MGRANPMAQCVLGDRFVEVNGFKVESLGHLRLAMGSQGALAAVLLRKDISASDLPAGTLATVVDSGFTYTFYEAESKLALPKWARGKYPQRGAAVTVLGCERHRSGQVMVVGIEDAKGNQYFIERRGLDVHWEAAWSDDQQKWFY